MPPIQGCLLPPHPGSPARPQLRRVPRMTSTMTSVSTRGYGAFLAALLPAGAAGGRTIGYRQCRLIRPQAQQVRLQKVAGGEFSGAARRSLRTSTVFEIADKIEYFRPSGWLKTTQLFQHTLFRCCPDRHSACPFCLSCWQFPSFFADRIISSLTQKCNTKKRAQATRPAQDKLSRRAIIHMLRFDTWGTGSTLRPGIGSFPRQSHTPDRAGRPPCCP